MDREIKRIINGLPEIVDAIGKYRETILANLIMVSEIPAPTFEESPRMNYLVNRFAEYQLINCSTDEADNALGILAGSVGDRNILLTAHLDTLFDAKVDHTVTVQPNNISGAGISDNGLGLASLTVIPFLLEELGIKLQSNLVMMGSSRSLGKGDLEGIRFFLNNSDFAIDAGICIEGVKLGRMSYSSIGMSRCEVTFSVPEEYDWTQFGAVGSIVTLNELINRILEIPLPKRPKTTIVLGSVEGGRGFNKIASKATLRFEIRSEAAETVRGLTRQIEDLAAELSSKSVSQFEFKVLSRRKPGGVPFNHPLPTLSRQVMEKLGIKPRISPSTSELSAFIDKDIPAITLGLTDGENLNQPDESIQIDPIFRGLAQIIGILQLIDEGYCCED